MRRQRARSRLSDDAHLPFSRLLTIVEVAVSIAVFVVTAIWTKALTKEDLNTFRRKRK
ncbi:MAG: hypothetical protein ACLT1X_12325 [Christensenellales bacterium]